MAPHEPPNAHLLRTVYVWTSFGAAGALLAAKLNVVWHDPWCTPRWTPYFIFFWRVRDSIGNLLLPLALGGIAGLVASRSARGRWEIWLALCLLFLAVYHAVST